LPKPASEHLYSLEEHEGADLTNYFRETVKCAMCGVLNEVMFFSITSQFGPMDLDMRPPERMRSTMHTWVHTCDNCGYSSSDISKEIEGGRKAMTSERYKVIRENVNISYLARAFLCFAIMLEQSGKKECAIYEILRAAWDCDDRGNEAKAKEFRIKTLSLIDEVNPSRGNITMNFIKIDLLRRVGQFEKAIEFAKSLDVEQELQEIVRYQTELCLAKDSGVHTFGEIGGSN
jgi:hypothetical protein